MRQYGLVPELVISSDAVRARLTAEAVAETAGYAGPILLNERLCPADILSVLRTVPANVESSGTILSSKSWSSN